MRPKERIPLHDHVDGNSGGPLDRSKIVAAVGGTGSLGGGSTATSSIAVAEDGTTVVAAATAINAGHGLDVTDEGGGVAGIAVDETELTVERSIEGGQSVIFGHGSMGAMETFDPTDGNVHTGILDADCTFTLTSPTGSGACVIEIRATQDGTGGWDISWPGSVAWIGGTPSPSTTASSMAIYLLETLDGGANWTGVMAGAGAAFAVPALTYGTPAAGAAATTIRSDATIAPPIAADIPVTDAGGYYTGTDAEAILQEVGAGLVSLTGLLTVDPGTPTYDVSGADVQVIYATKWGYDASGPYYNSAGAASGEEAILAIDPSDGELAVIPYNP